MIGALSGAAFGADFDPGFGQRFDDGAIGCHCSGTAALAILGHRQ